MSETDGVCRSNQQDVPIPKTTLNKLFISVFVYVYMYVYIQEKDVKFRGKALFLRGSWDRVTCSKQSNRGKKRKTSHEAKNNRVFRPGFFVFKMAGENKNRGILSRITEIAFSEVLFSDWQPCLFTDNLKPLLKRNEDISLCFTRQKNPLILEYLE